MRRGPWSAFVLFFALLLITPYERADASNRRDVLINIIDEELNEISRLSNRINHRRPDLLVRIAELYLEKARILREEENRRFLALPIKSRNKRAKRRLFRNSTALFKKAQKTAKAVIKKFRRFKKKGDIYYILAFNAKEFQRYKEAKKYFTLAIKNSKSGQKINLKAKRALAEFHFNDNDFKKAVKLYESSLRKKTDKWWTKDSYNLAWSYFRLKRYSKAISKMKEVINLSRSPNFIDVSRQAENDLGLFYSASGKGSQAISYFQQSGKNAPKKLIALAKKMMDQEKSTLAERVLNTALNSSDRLEQKIEISLLELRLYEKYGKYKKHLKVSERLYGYHQERPLFDEEKKTFLFQLKKMGAVLQRQVVKTYKTVAKKRKERGRLAARYFELAALMEPKESYQALLHSAETANAVGNHDQAVVLYHRTYDAVKGSGKKSRKFKKAAVLGMLDSLGKKVSKRTQKKYLISSYDKYLRLDSSSKRADRIFQRLFNAHMKEKNLAKAESTLFRYRKAFPKQVSKQEAMIAQVMDVYKDRNDLTSIRRYVDLIKKRKLNVSKKYALALNRYLLSVQFEDVEKANTRGNKVRALKGYFTIYHDPRSSETAKKNAAYNLAVLYHELKDPQKTRRWLSQSLQRMKVADIKKFEDSLFTMITELFYRRLFFESAKLFEDIFQKLCQTTSKKRELFFKNAHLLNIAQKKGRKARELTKRAQVCNIPKRYIENSELENLNFLISEGRNDELRKFMEARASKRFLWPFMIMGHDRLRKTYTRNGRRALASQMQKKMMSYYEKSIRAKMAVPLEALDVLAEFEIKKIEKKVEGIHRVKLKFPEKVYNSRLQKKFALLDKLTVQAINLLKMGSAKGIVRGYQILIETYQRLANEIQSFTPRNKSDQYIKSFQKGMKEVSSPLVAKSLEFLKQAKKQIRTDRILNENNNWFFSKSRLPVPLEYHYQGSGILMDRGGRR